MRKSLITNRNPNSYYNTLGRLEGPIYDDMNNIIIYDTFIRGTKLYFVSTFNNSVSPAFRIKVEGCKLTEVALNEQEPVRYLVCEVGVKRKFNIYVNGNIFVLKPPVIAPLRKRWRLAIATLFKFETPAMIQRFLEYYRMQGVEMFYLYYNGTELPKGVPQDVDVFYRLWDFRYWNDRNFEYIHCAQSVFLTTVRLMHKDDCEWLALIDLDEFIYSTNIGWKLVDYLESCKSYDLIRIRNYWSSCPDSGGPITFVDTTNELQQWEDRTKCIYNHSFNGLFAIHGPKKAEQFKEFKAQDLKLLHLTTLHPERNQLIKGAVFTSGLSLASI